MSLISSHLFSELEFLREENTGLKLQVLNRDQKLQHYEEENARLHEMLREFKRQVYGKKSERWESPEQGCLFNEAEVLARKPEDPNESAETDNKASAPAPRRGHRKPLPKSLEREVVKLELPLEEQVLEDGTPLKVIGWEISEKLKYEPAKMTVIEYHRAKYGADSGDYVKTAPPVPSIVPKGIPTPELLAAVAVGKYGDGLPLYRLEEIFARHDIELNRTTMARWMIQVAEACQPIWNVLSERWCESFYGACDETQVQVLKENGRKAESKSWMLVRATPYGDKKVVLFDYSTSRSSETMTTLIEGFKGYLQVDGLPSYDQVAGREGITRLGCAMHARRRFEKAATDGAKSGKTLAAMGLKYFKDLYDLEEEVREKSPEERHRLRNERAKPVWDEMLKWVKENQVKVPAKSKIGEAFTYLIGEYEYLIGYLEDGRLECDNGFTERAIRKFAIGRNNWLFSDQVEGAHASAVLYSLVVTAKINGVNPYRALVKLFAALPKANAIEDYERLAEIILTPVLRFKVGAT